MTKQIPISALSKTPITFDMTYAAVRMHPYPQLAPDNSGCGSAAIAGIDAFSLYGLKSFTLAKQFSQQEIAAEWTRQYIHGWLVEAHFAIAVGHTTSRAVRDALLGVEGWRCAGQYLSGHNPRSRSAGARTLYLMAYCLSGWVDADHAAYKEAPKVTVQAETPPASPKKVVVSRRSAKTPLAAAFGSVKMAVVKTKRAVKKTVRKSKIASS